jgi:hypothetical protein
MAITSNLVNEYIRAAEPLASSESEKLAVQFADQLNRRIDEKTQRHQHIDDAELFLEMTPKPEPEAREVDSWRILILSEIHSVLCGRNRRYQHEVDVLRSSGKLLIGAIAGYIAGTVGVAEAIVAALVASLLRLVVAMGISVFCKRFTAVASSLK